MTLFPHANAALLNDLCSWCPKLEVNSETGLVNCNQVVMSSGKGHVNGKRRCGLCGLNGGHKATCSGEACRGVGETRLPFSFHPTCARQAGYQVDQGEDGGFNGTYGAFSLTQLSCQCILPEPNVDPMVELHLATL